MSRIKGIEVKVQKEILQTRKYGLNEILKKSEGNPPDSKDEAEKRQIEDLLQRLPALGSLLDVQRKVGEGTFSSVYVGSLRAHSELPPAQRRQFAIKHLVPTAHPARVEHELRCLQDMGGRNNVIGVELCLRQLDTVVFIMPYIPHRKFSEYVGDMGAEELRQYMRALLQALRHVHSFGVIHRDVKPSNFLYDRENRRYMLVDFGLAQRLCPPEEAEAAPEPVPEPPPAHAASSRKRPREQESAAPDAKRAALDLRVSARAAPPAPAAPPPLAARPPPAHKPCACWGLGGVCAACGARAGARAARAGTQGYRPPEVLLKVARQSTAVDVWAAGVVLCAALTARYPFLRGAGDVAALAELADLLGSRALRRAALALRRRVLVSAPRAPLCLRRLAARLRGRPLPPGRAACARCSPPCVCRAEHEDAAQVEAGRTVAGFPDSAFALAARLLEPDPALRLSAAQALEHPFLRDP